MKKLILLTAAMGIALSAAGCNTPQGQNTLGGALIGGAGGAAIGAATSGGRASSTLLGGAIGATAGALIGSASTPTGYYAPPPQPGPYYGRCGRWNYDYYGNPVSCRWYY